MSNGANKEHTDERVIQILHPACHEPIQITSLKPRQGRITAYGFCTRCGKYVHLVVAIE